MLDRHGAAAGGCEVCKPTVASILASLDNGYILDGEQAALQDTNDHFLANIQKDGTYSVVPRVPGGEITPEGLIAIGEVARDFGLYTKITGGQRIDLFGARVEQLPADLGAARRRRLRVGPRLRQVAAHGEVVRRQQTWCRYGVQDSTVDGHPPRAALPGPALAAQDQDGRVGLRPRVRRGPEQGRRGHRHRDGAGTSTSAATAACGPATPSSSPRTSTTRPWSASSTASSMYYVRTADRLERTATWLEQLDGGIDHVRAGRRRRRARPRRRARGRHGAPRRRLRVRVDRPRSTDPDRLARFVSFVNAPDEPDPTVVFVRERGQIRPARPDELVGANA